MALPGLTLRPLDAAGDRDWAASFLDQHLGGRLQARRGELIDVLEGDGIVAALDGEPVGLITWRAESETGARSAADGAADGAAGAARDTSPSAEIRAVAVAPSARARGIGRALFEAAHTALAEAGVRSAWLVTTNDNAPAVHLYESLGYRLMEVRRGAIDELRRTIKPSIPLAGHGGIEMHDELELARTL